MQHPTIKVIDMTQETVRTNERRAFWLALAICLVPLIPYALRGGGA
ncbi:hypothetical protein ACFSJC_12925 [Thiorhodococcus fuscus]|uniref:Uncharacterized protein n=1 Tax=Thiorhodococcus fuscus TaxID=527200 RepID=A0ABW4YAE7_9GAMM